ncbi:MAG: nucleoside phosphorylase [Chthoniobacteraceae bacterium]|nr:nucleoside phosphorylase [Chthoniobacteraceae bacterium]
MKKRFPLLEYDPASEAIISPSRTVASLEVSRYCVLCFFHEVLAGLVKSGRAKPIHTFPLSSGPHPIYELENEGRRVVLVHPGIGAPMAVLLMEKLIALGCRNFIAVGGAGVLDRGANLGDVFVPTAAIRDEGTSYHYLPPGREVGPSADAVAAIRDVLEKANWRYTAGKTWTTDAFFRETPGRVALRKAEGCLTVEMEAAAFFAVAQFRNVTMGQILYAGDLVIDSGWDHRDWPSASCRAQLLSLAIQACLSLP